jgi:hypothetical protein
MSTQSTAVATMASIQDKVKERIQATFAELIPQEMWEGLVAEQVRKFQRDDLPNLVREAAKEEIKRMMTEEFAKKEWQDTWGQMGVHGGRLPSELVTKIVKEAAPDLVNALFGGLMQNIVASLRNNGGMRY